MVRGLDFHVTVFDTAPTGHTLRLLNMPTTMGNAISKVVSIKSQLGGLFGSVRTHAIVQLLLHGGSYVNLDTKLASWESLFQIMGSMGLGGNGGPDLLSKAEDMKKIIDEVGVIFRNPVCARLLFL